MQCCSGAPTAILASRMPRRRGAARRRVPRSRSLPTRRTTCLWWRTTLLVPAPRLRPSGSQRPRRRPRAHPLCACLRCSRRHLSPCGGRTTWWFPGLVEGATRSFACSWRRWRTARRRLSTAAGAARTRSRTSRQGSSMLCRSARRTTPEGAHGASQPPSRLVQQQLRRTPTSGRQPPRGLLWRWRERTSSGCAGLREGLMSPRASATKSRSRRGMQRQSFRACTLGHLRSARPPSSARRPGTGCECRR
mmetsp:Transcript_18218/g.44736  ORF Transcript_18218/g.44736 Transcript_18218/m.44736 type:complete len:249 (-) Transcript_18218:1272-2018(-)